MLRSIPLPAILLFLLLLKLVQTLDDSNRNETHATLFGRDDYIDITDILDDEGDQTDDVTDDNVTSVEPTKLNNVPTVTTIIIIQTTGGPTFRQLGNGGPSSSAGNFDSGAEDPNDDSLQTEGENDNSALKRLISIPTVIGGVAVVAIIAGAIVFMRLRAKRRHAKGLRQCQELASTYLNGNEGGHGNYHNGGGHERQYSSSSSTTPAYVSQPQQQHHPHLQSPLRNHDYTTNANIASIIPSAPLEPIELPNSQLRERHILSSLTQEFTPPSPSLSLDSSTPTPSAPSTKEIETNAPMDSGHVSRIDTDLQASSSYVHPLSSAATPSTSPTTTTTMPCSNLKSTDDPASSQLPSAPDMPPPAYTASAPPLFVLPPNHHRRSADQLSLDRYRRS